jgi:hypothetical protein
VVGLSLEYISMALQGNSLRASHDAGLIPSNGARKPRNLKRPVPLVLKILLTLHMEGVSAGVGEDILIWVGRLL